MGSQELSVNWNAHSSALVSEFQKLFLNKSLVDCTVAAEGQYLRVHKVVLSACSPYFQILLNEESEKHPIIILRDVKFEDLNRIIEFVYHGEVKLPEEKLFEFLSVAESLQIKGLGDKSNEAFGKRPIVDLLSKTRPTTLSSENVLNQSSRSGNVIEKSIICAKLSSSQNSNSQPQCRQPFINSIDIPSSSRSPSTSSNDIPVIVRNNSRGSDFSCSKAKPNQDNDNLPPFSTSDVKEEISIDEDFLTKEEYSCDEIGNEFREESYDFDTGNQDVKPSSSQQYIVPENVLPETQVGELNHVEVPENVLPETKVGELNHVEGFAANFDEAILPDTLQQTNENQQLYIIGSTAHPASARSQQPSHLEACDAAGIDYLRNMPDAVYTCHECQSVFSTKSSMQIHLRTHTGEKMHKCDVCNKEFPYPAHLKAHKLRHSGVMRPYQCEVCSKKFQRLSHLKQHMLIHAGLKEFKCDVCFQAFRLPCHLKVHKRIHMGEKPYSCSMCSKDFSRISSLNRHLLTHTM